jgi:hypothetical protein
VKMNAVLNYKDEKLSDYGFGFTIGVSLDSNCGVFRRYPVIITTAELYICKIDLSDIGIESGEIKNPEFMPVPFVRFRKSLTTTPPRFAFKREIRFPEELAEARQRTIFVLNASHIKEVLGGWEISGEGFYR